MLVYYFVPFIVSNRYLLFWVLNAHNSATVQNRTHVYMNFFDHKDLGNHLLQLCPKVVKHPVLPWKWSDSHPRVFTVSCQPRRLPYSPCTVDSELSAWAGLITGREEYGDKIGVRHSDHFTQSSFGSCADSDVCLSLNTCFHTTDMSSPITGLSRAETCKVRRTYATACPLL